MADKCKHQKEVLRERGVSWCCYIYTSELSCDFKPEWIIFHGVGPDEYTHSCTQHVGWLLTDAKEHRIYPLEASHA